VPEAPVPLVPRVPRPLLVVAAVTVVATAGMAVVGAWQTGVSWDETYHVARMRNFLAHGWYLLDGDLLDGQPGPWEDQAYVYAPVTALLMHAAAVLAGVEGGGEVVAGGQAYAVRHLVIAVLGLVGTVAVAATARILLRSWSWGLVAAAVLGAVPMWTGHTMFNVKDVPVAVGCTLVTLGLVRLVTLGSDGSGTRSGARPGARARGAALAVALVLVAGWVLALGTRPGIWPTLVASHVVALVLLAGRVRGEHPRAAGARSVVLAVPVVAWLVLLAVYPAIFATPVTTLRESVLSSSRFDDRQGQWYYVPALLVGETPLLLLTLLLIGTVVALRWVAGAVRRAPGGPDLRRAAWLLVGVQAWTLPLLGMVRESNLYNGLRQLLFMVPATALLMTAGIVAVVGLARRRAEASDGPDGPRSRVVPALLVALVALAVALPVLDQARLYPYNYAYATLPSYAVDEAADTDYWRTSVRELAPSIPADGWVTCSPSLDGDRQALRRSLEGDEDCAGDLIGPLSSYADERSGELGLGPTEFLGITAGPRPADANCVELARVTRPGPLLGLSGIPGLPERDVMSRLTRCQLVLPDYPAEGLTFGPDGNGGAFELGGWSAHMSEDGIGLAGGTAQVGVALPGADAAGDARLVLRLRDGDDVTATVNGVAVDLGAADTDGRRSADVPADALAAYGDDRVVVALTRAEPTSDGPEPRLLALDLEEDR